jgi:hypothetical protein
MAPMLYAYPRRRGSKLRAMPAFLPAMLAEDRKRAGWTVEQAERRLGVSAAIYRELEAGTRAPAWEMWDWTSRRSAGRRRSSQ